MKLILVISAYVLLLTSCNLITPNNNQTSNNTPINVDESQNPYQPREDEKPEAVLIYCDLTTSIKQDGILKISEKLKEVLLTIPRESVITIRLIEKDLFSESIYSGIKTPSQCDMPQTTINRKRREAQKECIEKDKIYVQIVEDISSKIKTLKPQKNISCIIDSLEAAHDFFKGKDGNNYKFRLIYFSDMIEQCDSNDIYLCSTKRKPKIDDILGKVERNFNPSYDLSKLLKDELSVIITTSENQNDRCLLLSEKKQVWELVFKKVGYSNLNLLAFNFTQEIPDKFKR